MLPVPAGSNEKLALKRDEIRDCIEEIGIIPTIRESSPVNALFAAESVQGGGIPIVEVTIEVDPKGWTNFGRLLDGAAG